MNLTILQYVVSNGMILNCMFKFEERFSVNSRDFVDLGARRNLVDRCVYEWDIFDAHVGILGYLGFEWDVQETWAWIECYWYPGMNEIFWAHRYEWDILDTEDYTRYSGYPSMNVAF